MEEVMRYWRHFTTGTIETVNAALSSARSGTFGMLPTEPRAAQMRALLAVSLQAATITDTQGPLGLLSPSLYGGDDERNAAGAAIARTAMVLMPPMSASMPYDVLTADGKPALPMPVPQWPDVSALPALAIVAMACMASMAAGYIASVIAQANHGIAFEEEKTKRVLGLQAEGIDMFGKHIEREKQAGKLLPFEPEERSILQSIEATQREIAKERNVPFPTPFDGARDFGKALADSTSKIGQSTADAISMIAPIAIVGGLVWLASK
jgi:hypothetical protein